MAESKDAMARLDRLEGALVQITDVLVLQSERLDALRDEVRVTREALTDRLDGLGDRLDRLIAITTNERTVGVERLASIEQRLTKLEEHVGI
jgi:hypothetical protein